MATSVDSRGILRDSSVLQCRFIHRDRCFVVTRRGCVTAALQCDWLLQNSVAASPVRYEAARRTRTRLTSWTLAFVCYVSSKPHFKCLKFSQIKTALKSMCLVYMKPNVSLPFFRIYVLYCLQRYGRIAVRLKDNTKKQIIPFFPYSCQRHNPLYFNTSTCFAI